MEIKKKNAEQAKENRLKEKTETEIEQIKEGNRIRAKRHREKQKALGIEKKRIKPKTRQKILEQREYWRIKKQDSRSRSSCQKKRRVKEKDRMRKMSQNKKTRTKPANGNSVFSSPSAEEKATQRVKQYLPKCAEKMARVVMNIISNASPKKHAALARVGITTPKKRKVETYCFNNIKRQIFRLKSSNKKSEKTLRRALVSACIQSKVKSAKNVSRHLGIKWSYLNKCSELNMLNEYKVRSDKIPEEITEDVKDFFLHPQISTPLPDKRLVNKDGKAAHIMHRSLLDTFQIYKEKNPSVKLGKSKFASLRPKNVKTFCDQQLQQCLCEYCLNVELKLKTVNKLIGRSCENAEELKIKDKYCAVNIVMCPKGDNQYHKKDCIDGLCNICGEQKMRTHLKDVTNKYGVDYYVWAVTDNKEKKKGLILKSSNSNTLIDELCSEILFLKKHLFIAHWELGQFQNTSQHPPVNCVIAVLDFGRNYVCEFQDEPQFLYWIHTQITVHPVVCYYKCNEKGCNSTVKEDVVFLSEDIRHDAHAVNWYENKTFNL